MRTMGKFLCMIGVHRWLHKRNPEGGEPYLECSGRILLEHELRRHDIPLNDRQ